MTEKATAKALLLKRLEVQIQTIIDEQNEAGQSLELAAHELLVCTDGNGHVGDRAFILDNLVR